MTPYVIREIVKMELYVDTSKDVIKNNHRENNIIYNTHNKNKYKYNK